MPSPRSDASGMAAGAIVLFLGVAVMVPKDMLIADMTLGESLATRGIVLVAKPFLGPPYRIARDWLVKRYGTTPRRQFIVDSVFYGVFQGATYGLIMLAMHKTEERIVLGTAITLATSLAIGGGIGRAMDGIADLLRRLTTRIRDTHFPS